MQLDALDQIDTLERLVDGVRARHRQAARVVGADRRRRPASRHSCSIRPARHTRSNFATGDVSVAAWSTLHPLPTEPAAAPELTEPPVEPRMSSRIRSSVARSGLIVGSFLNVCIHRLPLRESVMWPASRCPHCRAELKPYDNIPVVSYLMLRGRCRSCGKPISVQYPIVELLTGVLFLAAFMLFEPPLLYQRLLFACAMVVLFVIDLEHRILPDVITLPGIILGVRLQLLPAARDGWIR